MMYNPLFDSSLRDCVVFLTQDTENDNGQIERTACATGFIVAAQAEVNKYWMVYVVTARHCLDNSNANSPIFVRFNNRQNKYVDTPINFEQWIQHPCTDVCVAPLKLTISDDPHILFIKASWLLSDEQIKTSSLREGNEILYISLFSQHVGRSKILPVTRTGRIALMPHEKVTVQVGPKNHKEADAYLIEARSLSGHSGSPVFVIYPEAINDHNGDRSLLRLLGVLSGHFEIDRKVEMLGDICGSASVRESSGISIVIPSQAIIDLIMDQDEIVEREKRAKELEKELASQR